MASSSDASGGDSLLAGYGLVAVRVALAAVIAVVLARHGLRKKSLSPSGARAAFAVGFTSFAMSYRFGVVLIAFYYSSSRLTK
jgi:uncharacterized membrane protein